MYHVAVFDRRSPWELPCPAAAVAMAKAEAGDMVQRELSPDVTEGKHTQ